MKELSIEEKAKAYDGAIERAKNLHKDAIDMGENIRAKQCEIIFPELAESEDEKIRKMLIDSFTRADMGGEIYGKGVTYKQVIAWLEKQDSTWSEEDEQIVLSIEQVMACASLLNIVPEKIDKIRTWLKSLKERIGG